MLFLQKTDITEKSLFFYNLRGRNRWYMSAEFGIFLAHPFLFLCLHFLVPKKQKSIRAVTCEFFPPRILPFLTDISHAIAQNMHQNTLLKVALWICVWEWINFQSVYSVKLWGYLPFSRILSSAARNQFSQQEYHHIVIKKLNLSIFFF